ncbi:inorganic diphosphatase [[Mycoplasma] mobile]|uniref:Inorganic pyrophosphatase n=1 Tax=Mycoplasma mobile (strain ATCC 43663 / 163K / NCTC 11711) TaxID=267748 RepID=Q6KHC3_MYCM1|nr:inorganic diphosphatase [[Mycoplasma] mobile]AAT28007.1 inorganic pyrophosphatase [Mycoplasma mobile 163K]
MNEKIIEVNIEIPINSNIKYEFDRSKNKIVVDRILRGDFKYPANYGYVAEALDWDGDELDVLVYSSETFVPGSLLRARLVGAMKMIDQGETDTKLIAVHADDYRLDKIKELVDIPKEWLRNVEYFFTNYKNWKGVNQVKINGFEGLKYALAEYEECVHQMEKYGKMPKSEYVKQMQKKHPEKYTI